MTFSFWKSKWFVFGIALISFAAGSLVTARVARIDRVRADSSRLFELRVYHDVPGKLPVMEARFREKTSKILARHNLNVVGYWVTTDRSESENSFIFMLAHQTREEAKKNWEGVRSDPEFQEIEKAEQAEKTLEKAELIYMRPTDFSPMK
jgi:NIPSNAP protein